MTQKVMEKTDQGEELAHGRFLESNGIESMKLKIYGLSIHQPATLCIGRRFSGFFERPPRQLNNIPDGKGVYITLIVPERNWLKHEWY